MRENLKPGLYWSERGAIACRADAPYRGSDHWSWERWRRMTAREIANFTTEVGRPPACECCGKTADTLKAGV